MPDDTPRWKYRFDNFSRALSLLNEAIDRLDEVGLSQLEKEGTIQRFEYTMELAWNVIKDYLQGEGVAFPQATPRAVLRRAFEMGVVNERTSRVLPGEGAGWRLTTG